MAEESICDPMSFLYLDMLSTHLIKDIKDIAEEYENKMAFVREQEYICLENNKQLIHVDQLLSKFNECISYTELELAETNMCLIEAEKFILRCENACLNRWIAPECAQLMPKPSNYLSLLKLILSADCSASKCNNMREEIELFNKEACQHLAPYQMMTKIMDIHAKALNCLEEQVNHVQKLVTEVTNEHDAIAKNLNITSLSTKCNCEMAKQINDVHIPNLYTDEP